MDIMVVFSCFQALARSAKGRDRFDKSAVRFLKFMTGKDIGACIVEVLPKRFNDIDVKR